jgi:hypothetical protein
MKETIVFEGPDGRLYEIPAEEAARFAVPGPKVAELRKRLAAPAGNGGGAPAGHFRPGDPLPPGVPPPPSTVKAPSASTTIQTPNGGNVTLNFFFAEPKAEKAAAAGDVEGYHMTFDANGIPTNHLEMLWGDYIDKQGHPAVGWHSHDPVTGNAQ